MYTLSHVEFVELHRNLEGTFLNESLNINPYIVSETKLVRVLKFTETCVCIYYDIYLCIAMAFIPTNSISVSSLLAPRIFNTGVFKTENIVCIFYEKKKQAKQPSSQY